MARKGQTVTRFSHNPLAKKFKCPQCGNWFRTLQGLSGHIRFKHGLYGEQEDIVDQLTAVEKQKISLAAWGQGAVLPPSTIQARLQTLDRWGYLLQYCYSFGVRLDAEDYKNYVIRSFELESG